MQQLAQLTSYISHPLLVPNFLLYLVIFFYNPTLFGGFEAGSRYAFLGICLFITFGGPASYILFLYLKGEINDIYIKDRKKRKLPMILSCVCFAATAYQLEIQNFPRVICDILWVSAIGVAISYIINLYWKISLHAMGISALCSIIYFLSSSSYYNYNSLFVICVVVAGLVGSARLILNAHSLNQVLAGFFIGSLAYFFF